MELLKAKEEKKEYSSFGFDLAHVIEAPIAFDPAARSKDLFSLYLYKC